MNRYFQTFYLIIALVLLSACKGSEEFQSISDGLYEVKFDSISEDSECNSFFGILEAHNEGDTTWLKTGLYADNLALCSTMDDSSSRITDLEHCRNTVLTTTSFLYAAADVNGDLVFLENVVNDYHSALGLPRPLINFAKTRLTLIFEGNLNSGGVWQGFSNFSGSESCSGFWRIK